MSPADAVLGSTMHRMGTLSLLVLLVVVHTLMGLTFRCPSGEVMAIVYGMMFLFLPVVVLFMLGLLLRTRRSPSLVGPECHSLPYVLYVTAQAGRAPLLWFLISLIDGRYFSCFVLNVGLHWRYQTNLFPATQVSGLILLVIFLVLDYGIPRCTWAKELLSSLYQKRHEDLVLQEVEVALQQKAEEKRKAFIQQLLRDDHNRLEAEDFLREETVDVVWRYKLLVQKKCEEGSASLKTDRVGHAGGQEPKTVTAGTAGGQEPKTDTAGTAGGQELNMFTAGSADSEELKPSIEDGL